MARPPAIRVLHDAMTVGVPNMLGHAIAQSAQDLDSVVVTLGQALLQRKAPREQMRRANIALANAAHAAVVNGWRSRLPAHTPTGSEKHLSGYLGRALADPYNTQYTTDRVISFINTELMDREAVHWYRVNYGAAGSRYGESRPRESFEIILNNVAVGRFEDSGKPDPRSWIPKRRYWVPPHAQPSSMFPRKSASGVVEMEVSPYGARAARFIDLGHEVIAHQAPTTYSRLWRDYLNEGQEAVRSRLRRYDINVVGDIRLQRDSWSARVQPLPRRI